MVKKLFFAEDEKEWVLFYTERNKILGFSLPKKEYPTLQDFKKAIPKCEDGPIEPEELIGLKIVEIAEEV